jgi:selenocysteine-specific translation elongation factor
MHLSFKYITFLSQPKPLLVTPHHYNKFLHKMYANLKLISSKLVIVFEFLG